MESRIDLIKWSNFDALVIDRIDMDRQKSGTESFTENPPS